VLEAVMECACRAWTPDSTTGPAGGPPNPGAARRGCSKSVDSNPGGTYTSPLPQAGQPALRSPLGMNPNLTREG